MFQIAVVHFYSGISKFSPDWLSGKIISIPFNLLAGHNSLGILYAQPWLKAIVIYGGITFNLVIVPFLLYKKTRNLAFLAAVVFHLFNSFTFNIGVFPYLCIALNLVFLDSKDLQWLFFLKALDPLDHKPVAWSRFQRKVVVALLASYFMIQVMVPIRPWLFPGDVFWTEEGYRMSWKLMMRTKSGVIYFKVITGVGDRVFTIDPIQQFDSLQVSWIACSPDMTWQYAQRIKSDFQRKGMKGVRIFAIGSVSLNGSVPRPLIDTSADLAALRWEHFKHSSWITEPRNIKEK